MKSQQIINQILYTESLLSMDGIIPSLSLWHEKIQRLVLQLQQTLQIDGASPAQATAFCCLLCGLLDKRMNLLRMKHHWGDPNFSLAVNLYGQSNPPESLAARLRELAQGKSGAVATFSQMLLGWLSPREGGIEDVRIAADWHEEPSIVAAPPKSERISAHASTLLLAFLSAFSLISLWFFLNAYSHV